VNVSGLDSATKVAKTIVVFLTSRSDLMVVLFWPEWPAASLLLGVICKFMVSDLRCSG
jgi:cohesin loading factor subunit SCC2